MIRKFNYTNRLPIKRDRIQISLTKENRYKSFDAVLEIKDLGVPEESKIYIEPYFKTNQMRFDFGTVGEILQPKDRRLIDLLATDLIYFRIKIIDESKKNGRILAMVSGIQPVELKKEPAKKRAILSVNFDAELGQRLFSIEFDNIEDVPILEINRKLKSRSELVRSDLFLSTIFPSVVKEIATEIVFDSDYNWTDEDDCWQGYWLKYFKINLGLSLIKPSLEADYEERREWLEAVVDVFCATQKVRNKFLTVNF